MVSKMFHDTCNSVTFEDAQLSNPVVLSSSVSFTTVQEYIRILVKIIRKISLVL